MTLKIFSCVSFHILCVSTGYCDDLAHLIYGYNLMLFSSPHSSKCYRSFAKPPKQVQVVCECILVIRSYKEINWKTAKGMMSEANFLRSLMEMDCDLINAGQIKTVKCKPASALNKNHLMGPDQSVYLVINILV